MHLTTQHALEQTAISVSTKMVGAGGVTAVGSGVAGKVVEKAAHDPAFVEQALSISEIGVYVGIALGVIGYLTQLIFHIRRDRRDKRLTELREKVIRERVGVDDTA